MNRVAVITGASSGIGKSLAIEAAKKGFNVVLAARSVDKLNQVANQCNGEGVRTLVVACDVGQEADCKSLMEQTISKFGRIDILFNNAGISMRSILENTTPDVIEKVMQINFFGAVYCTKYALASLLENKGSVVGVSSIAGYKGLPGRTGYSASKFAMHGFLESLRVENLKKGLHVLIACPGFTASNIRNTALTGDGTVQGESPREEQKMMQPEEVAAKIFDAVDARKNYLVMTANGKLIVWINKFFSKWADKLIFKHMSKEPDSPF